MGISHHLGEKQVEFDVVIAGGGTAACILAGRLSAADPSLEILVIERGKNNYNDPTVTNPAVFLTHLAPDSNSAIFYKAKKDANLANREAIVPMGGMLGGGSSINFMMYTRAQGIDFDSWKTEGWDQKSILPMLKKLETFHQDHASIDQCVHGYDGPIHISDGGFRATRAEDELLKVTASLGYPEILDLQDLKQNNGFSRWQRYVSPDGKRQDTAHRYLHPLLQDGEHPNLHVLLQTKVVRVLFDDNKQACGVEYTPSEEFQPLDSLSKTPLGSVRARKMVIVSSGALGSPQVLERSGVGNARILESLNIPIISDLSGVGENYQDHHLLLVPYKTSLAANETNDVLLSGRMDFAKALEEKNPVLGWNSIDIAGKIRPTDSEVAELGPEFQTAWDKDYKHAPERPLMLMGAVSSFLGDPNLVPQGQYLTMGCYTAYPYSRGSIHITGNAVTDPPDFSTGFLNDPGDIDLKMQIWAYKKQREIVRRLSTYRGELELGHPKFPEGSKAALVDVKGGCDRSDLPPIQYGKEDDKAIEQWIRENLNTTWHSMSTCSMAPLKDGGVVDKNLNVYGVGRLKVADLSIAPENVGANTNNTALMIGEMSAVIVGRELGLNV